MRVVHVPGGVVGEVVVTRVGELTVNEGLVEEAVGLAAQVVAGVHRLHEVAELVGGVGVVRVLEADLHRPGRPRPAEQVRAVDDPVHARDLHARAHPVGELDAAAARRTLARASRGGGGVGDAERAAHGRPERPGERPGAARGEVVVDGGDRERVVGRDQALPCGERHACGDEPTPARAKQVEVHVLLVPGSRLGVGLGRLPKVVAQVLLGGFPRARQLVGRLLERGLQQVGGRLARVEADAVEGELAPLAPRLVHAARLVAHGEQRGEKRVGAVARRAAPGQRAQEAVAAPRVGGRVEEARARHGRRLDPHHHEDGLAPGGSGVACRPHEGLARQVHGALQVGAVAERGVRGLAPALRGCHHLERARVAARAAREAHVVAVQVRLVDVERHERDHVRVVADHADARRRGRVVVLRHEARDGGVERVGEVGGLGPAAVGEAREDPVRAHHEHDVMRRPVLLTHGHGGGERGEPHHKPVPLVGERDVEPGRPRLLGAAVDGLVDPDAPGLAGGVAALAGIAPKDRGPPRGRVGVGDL